MSANWALQIELSLMERNDFDIEPFHFHIIDPLLLKESPPLLLHEKEKEKELKQAVPTYDSDSDHDEKDEEKEKHQWYDKDLDPSKIRHEAQLSWMMRVQPEFKLVRCLVNYEKIYKRVWMAEKDNCGYIISTTCRC